MTRIAVLDRSECGPIATREHAASWVADRVSISGAFPAVHTARDVAFGNLAATDRGPYVASSPCAGGRAGVSDDHGRSVDRPDEASAQPGVQRGRGCLTVVHSTCEILTVEMTEFGRPDVILHRPVRILSVASCGRSDQVEVQQRHAVRAWCDRARTARDPASRRSTSRKPSVCRRGRWTMSRSVNAVSMARPRNTAAARHVCRRPRPPKWRSHPGPPTR